MNKRNLILIILCILLIFLFLMFYINYSKYYPSIVGDDCVEVTSIDFSASYQTKEKILSYTIKNNNNFEIEYGEDFYIEILKDNTWYRVNNGDSWVAISYTLLPDDEKKISVSINSKLKSGNYRVVKFVNVPTKNAKGNIIIAYFEI